ncbi:MAG TPA: serine/threonine-protein kinase, partial [Polyangiaceae bacterium]
MASQFSNQSFRVGDPIGDYVLVRFIGAGGMGEVYEARHKLLGTRQAIKFLRRDHVCRSDLLARFEQEARIASTLDSQHIVKVREFCLTKTATPYMVMDLANGGSLASVLAQVGQLEATRAIDLAHQVGVGLCVAHEKRIVHRDLKPDNLYVCPQDDGTELLKILDFGIAKHLGSTNSGPTTETGSNLGTAHYMSP